MQKIFLVTFLIYITSISCKTEQERIEYTDIEMEYYKFYKKNSNKPFSGIITANLPKASIEFEVKNGVKNGHEIIIEKSGDTISYCHYEKGKKIITRAYSEGERLYTANFKTTKIRDNSNREVIQDIKKYIQNKDYKNLDMIAIKGTKQMFGEKFWRNFFTIQDKTIGQVVKVKINNSAEYTNSNNDTIVKVGFLLKFDNTNTDLNIRVTNDSISGLTFPTYDIDIIPINILNNVFDKLKNQNIMELFPKDISDTQIEKINSDMKKLGKLQDTYEFKQHFVNQPVNGIHIISSDYIIQYLNQDGIIKYVLTINVSMKNEKLIHQGFNIKPLRASILFN